MQAYERVVTRGVLHDPREFVDIVSKLAESRMIVQICLMTTDLGWRMSGKPCHELIVDVNAGSADLSRKAVLLGINVL